MEVKLNFEIMINGMPFIEGYSIDEFKMIAKQFHSDIIDEEHNDFVFYMSMNLVNHVFGLKSDPSNVFYSVLCKSEQVKLDVDVNDNKLKNKIEDLTLEYAVEKVIKLERKLRLITNYSIYLPIIKINIKTLNGDDFTSVSLLRHVFNPRMDFTNDDYDRVLNRARMWFDLTFIEDLENKNTRFKKAMEMFNSLFMIDNVQTKFVLAFTALEVLLVSDEENITSTLSDIISKIMMYQSEKKTEKIKHKICNFYDKRSRFIHSAETTVVTEKNEWDLREILRKVLLIYFFISKTKNFSTTEEVITYLNETTYGTLDSTIKIFISALEDIDFENLTAFAKSIVNND